jgi:ketosteroid isomerase-like protein
MVPMIAIVVSLWVASATYGQDLDALKASFTEEIKALDSRNLDAAVAPVEDGIVLFGLFSPFPVKGKDAYRQVVQEYFAMYERATFAPVNPQLRIAGTTGIAWGYYEFATKLKDGESNTPPARLILAESKCPPHRSGRGSVSAARQSGR